MKRKNLLALFILALVITTGCKKDEETTTQSGSFMLKGEKFEISSDASAATGVLQLMHDLAEGSTSGSFSITGSNASKTGIIQIAVDYTTSTGIAGDYKNGDIFNGDHTFDPWLSSYSTYSASGTNMISGNEADGTLTVTKNSSDSFTVSFNLIFSDSTTASGNITQKYTVQEMNL
jgi:hypothetical protein